MLPAASTTIVDSATPYTTTAPLIPARTFGKSRRVAVHPTAATTAIANPTYPSTIPRDTNATAYATCAAKNAAIPAMSLRDPAPSSTTSPSQASPSATAIALPYVDPNAPAARAVATNPLDATTLHAPLHPGRPAHSAASIPTTAMRVTPVPGHIPRPSCTICPASSYSAATMKAMAAADYGPLDRLASINAPQPTPGRGELRVRVVASALNPADYKVILGIIKFLHARNRPLVLGYDFSGVVDAVGPKVSDFAAGDEVFGFLPYGPGNARGAFAEYLVARSDQVARKPASVGHELAAAAATTGLTAIQSIRDLGRLPREGAECLVTGVSGGVGSIGIGVARRLGAKVTAVGSGAGLELARRLGASAALDRTKESLPGDLRDRFDVIFDAAAAYRWGQWHRALRRGGAFVTTLPSAAFAVDKLRSLFSSTRVHFVNVKSRPDDLRLLASWLEDGLEVPLAATIPVRDIAKGLAQLQKSGGRIAVQVADAF